MEIDIFYKYTGKTKPEMIAEAGSIRKWFISRIEAITQVPYTQGVHQYHLLLCYAKLRGTASQLGRDNRMMYLARQRARGVKSVYDIQDNQLYEMLFTPEQYQLYSPQIIRTTRRLTVLINGTPVLYLIEFIKTSSGRVRFDCVFPKYNGNFEQFVDDTDDLCRYKATQHDRYRTLNVQGVNGFAIRGITTKHLIKIVNQCKQDRTLGF